MTRDSKSGGFLFLMKWRTHLHLKRGMGVVITYIHLKREGWWFMVEKGEWSERCY